MKQYYVNCGQTLSQLSAREKALAQIATNFDHTLIREDELDKLLSYFEGKYAEICKQKPRGKEVQITLARYGISYPFVFLSLGQYSLNLTEVRPTPEDFNTTK